VCGIAGIVDLAGRRDVAPERARAMAQALHHRGPDEDGFLFLPGLALASRRLSIVGLADGRQPVANEDRSVAAVFNGELFDFPERRAELEGRGHVFRTRCDTELIPHLWEDHREGMFDRLRGQFALALLDWKQRRLVLARDHFGICPLYWTRQGDWLLFASEVKALLASGLVEGRPDPRGINHVFTFFSLPGPVTCFDGVRLLPPGHWLDVRLPHGVARGEGPAVRERVYWEMDFPDAGQEQRSGDPRRLAEGLEAVLAPAVARRLRADVPVVSYLSGGVDSGVVVALANRLRGEPIPTFTVRVHAAGLDEGAEAAEAARHVGSPVNTVGYGPADVLATYPGLVRAAESPVIDTSCAALLLLAQEVHRQGYKAALTGEGADEWLAGYPWYKVERVLGLLDAVPCVRLGGLARRAFLKLQGLPQFPAVVVRNTLGLLGGPNAWLNIYGLVSSSKLIFFGERLRGLMAEHSPYADLGLPSTRMRRWHPLNRGLYLGARVHLAGMLLHAKGDRVAMHSSVETRYPFLDLEVFDFLARLHPRWKLRGFRDKYLLRLLAERLLPRETARRPKAMFRAPLDSFFVEPLPPWVGQLLSRESLARTGYFDANAVGRWVGAYRALRQGSKARLCVEMGLVGVVSTQLWHQTYIDGGLADLPTLAGARPRPGAAAARSAAGLDVGGRPCVTR
jgi:asparagine synthase (glutamine-hydrolysing)